MHKIEPHYNWRDRYIASEDERSPFFGCVYDEFNFSKKIYNYYIHPQWDTFGSMTLYLKIIYVDYNLGCAIFEMMGEWNDAIGNDIMFLKRDVVDDLTRQGIHKFILLCDNVLNFHSGEEDYYEEWYEDIRDEDGWICLLNTLDHVTIEMKEARISDYVNFGEEFNQLNWRTLVPKVFCEMLNLMMQERVPKFLR